MALSFPIVLLLTNSSVLFRLFHLLLHNWVFWGQKGRIDIFCLWQELDSKLKSLDKSSLFIFSIFSSLVSLVQDQIISYINIYHLFNGQQYIISFTLQFVLAGDYLLFGSGSDIFRYADEGTWQKPLAILTAKDRWSNISSMSRAYEEAIGRSHQVKEYKHTHTCNK